MFGINGVEFIIIVVIALVVIGPERMPEYAQQAKEFIKSMRRMAFDAKDDLKETLGPGLEDINWRQYDPRQYDPRTIVREALAEDDAEREKERSETQAQGRELTPAANASSVPPQRLSAGALAPFDIEAT
ncbi:MULTISPECIES: twin-arginine translocase TatA/TatE family subunit [unclassified Rothia (in: high G+C Gram-positive bacteria)]|uniref:twin-arginine translocase TatA/TatE family subunit n=1 Tax=unclassified Rothia (in: high G+C Gram-positive bacteria) TaxID=2689056 RepID=UPI0019589155|nr:twin-arginine translocase TatA/TatE family subunit [Rothia sp. ZJ932]MBM7051097.1 twin-arginine translocase TatA/TatE family subunit [Rothia sp. ZJ1223]QRZ62201.1 twin-arginine translocase TatA/TatE family subunit [Rothia sp. ZJ932]